MAKKSSKKRGLYEETLHYTLARYKRWRRARRRLGEEECPVFCTVVQGESSLVARDGTEVRYRIPTKHVDEFMLSTLWLDLYTDQQYFRVVDRKRWPAARRQIIETLGPHYQDFQNFRADNQMLNLAEIIECFGRYYGTVAAKPADKLPGPVYAKGNAFAPDIVWGDE